MPKAKVKLGAAISAVVVLLAIGTVSYHYIEGWRFIDSFYFTSMTLTTVGFGDFVPSHDASKLFTVFFGFAGIGIMFFALSVLAGSFFEHRGRLPSIEKAIKNGKKRRR